MGKEHTMSAGWTFHYGGPDGIWLEGVNYKEAPMATKAQQEALAEHYEDSYAQPKAYTTFDDLRREAREKQGNTPKPPTKKPSWDLDQILADAHRIKGEYEHTRRKYTREQLTKGCISVPAALVVELITSNDTEYWRDKANQFEREVAEAADRGNKEIERLKELLPTVNAAPDPVSQQLRDIVGRMDEGNQVHFEYNAPRGGQQDASITACANAALIVRDLFNLLMSIKMGDNALSPREEKREAGWGFACECGVSQHNIPANITTFQCGCSKWWHKTDWKRQQRKNIPIP